MFNGGLAARCFQKCRVVARCIPNSYERGIKFVDVRVREVKEQTESASREQVGFNADTDSVSIWCCSYLNRDLASIICEVGEDYPGPQIKGL